MAPKRSPTRDDVVLAALAAAQGDTHTPVQVQKLLFLVDENLAGELGGKHFHFEPYHYGPFDKQVYSTLDHLAQQGLVDISIGQGNWRNYRLTPKGQERGDAIRSGLSDKAIGFIGRASDFVRKHSFSTLVAAIYKRYPHMRARSVFQD